MHRKQRGFLIALVPLSSYLCQESSGSISYRREQAQDRYRKQTADQSGRRNRRQQKMLEREAANSTGTSGQRPDTQENETEEAKIETEEDHPENRGSGTGTGSPGRIRRSTAGRAGTGSGTGKQCGIRF